MTLCGAPTATGGACKRAAGWGTAHKGEGRCKHHDAVSERAANPAGRIHHAPEYTIGDGDYYAMPTIRPSFAARTYADVPQVAQYVEWTRNNWDTTQKRTMRHQFDAPYRSGADMPVYTPYDDPLEEWPFDTRLMVWTNAHAAYQRNPIAKQAIQLTRQFAVGKGHTVTCRNTQVRDALEQFRQNTENAIAEYDKTLLQDLFVDGELFIRKFSGGPDGSVIVPLPPWHIWDIDTEPGFFRRVAVYHMRYSDNYGNVYEDELTPDEVLHVAINRHSYELRGRSDLFTVLPWLRAYKEWLENRARQNQWRGALIWDVAIDGTPDSVTAAGSRYSQPPTPGSVVVHHANEQWQALTNSVGAGDAAEDGRQIKLMAAVGVGLPEYMLSDGENANLASATAQELPALWKFVDAQEIMREQVWIPIYKWVLQQAIDAGDLADIVPAEDPDGDPIMGDNGEVEQVPTLEAFTVDYPELQESDPKTLAEALQIAAMNQWVSDEGAASVIAGKFGLEPNIESKRVMRQRERERDEIGQGLRVPVPDMDDDGQQDTETTTAE